jgi:hypothetical protein
VCKLLAVAIEPVAEKVPVEGSYNSALDRLFIPGHDHCDPVLYKFEIELLTHMPTTNLRLLLRGA